jgi:hypothetical protein
MSFLDHGKGGNFGCCCERASVLTDALVTGINDDEIGCRETWLLKLLGGVEWVPGRLSDLHLRETRSLPCFFTIHALWRSIFAQARLSSLFHR